MPIAIRFYLTENTDGTATLSYRRPSSVFAPYFDRATPDLKTLAAELDAIFDRKDDVAAKAAAPLGAAFTFLALVTGSLWGRPMWGTYWEWDARLTSVLILFLMYLGIMALWRAVEDPSRAARAAAILTLVGAINIPIIKFSVDWWNTLHQPASVFRMGGSTIDASLLYPLLVCAIGATFLFLALALMAMRNEILRRRIRALELVAVAAASGAAA